MGVSVPIGSALEPLPGISSVLVSHLQRNTEDKNEDEFANYIDSLGIETFGNANRDNITIGVKTPPQHTEDAFEILMDMLLKPEFKQPIIGKIVQQQSGQLQQIQSNPENVLSGYTTWRSAFGQDPITRHPLGEFEELQKITPEQLYDWNNQIQNYKLYFAGVGVDLSEKRIPDLETLQDAFGEDKPNEALSMSDNKESLRYEVDTPPMPSSNVYIGINYRLPAPTEFQGEHRIYNAIVSGGMSARMFTEIREKLNLSYAPRSSLNSFYDGMKISSMMDVREEKAEKALETTVNLMYDVLTDDIKDDEMKRALKAAQRVAVFVADSSKGYANFLLSRIRAGLEYDLDEIKKMLEETSKRDWQENLLQYWDEEHLSFSLSGDTEDMSEAWKNYAEKVI